MAAGGPRAVSIEAVARSVGIAPSAIYRHYAGKDEILDGVLEGLRERLLANVAAARAESPDPVARLHGILGRHVALVRETRAMPRIMFSDEMAGLNAARRRRVHQILAAYRGQVEEIVAEGQRQGRIRADLPPATAALMLVGLFLPGLLLWHISDFQFEPDSHIRRAWEVFREAIEVNAPRAAAERVGPGRATGPAGPARARRAKEAGA